jgi:hypothetical protein
MTKLLTTAEAAAATGISQYELRIGAKSGRYPVIMLGDPANQFRKMRWNLEALNDALRQQMNQNTDREGER